MPTTFDYTVNFLDPGSHVYHVTLDIDQLPKGRHTLTFPVWTPGAYEVQDFARHVFELHLESSGKALEVNHLTKNQWGFETFEEATHVTVHYQVWAFELGVDTCHLDQSHAYWNGAGIYFLVDQYKENPYRVHIEAPVSWHASTGLDPVPSQPMTYLARDYDILLDSPVEVGTHRTFHFSVDDKPHTVAIWGHGNEDPEKLVHDIEAIVRIQRDMFGALPYEHYTFILHLPDRGTGGLEHLNSTTCGINRFHFKPWKKYRQVLGLISHEFFHLWNVKRIHPDMLGPFDYTQEVYTHLLWAMEGFTDYYASLTLRRSDLFTVKDYLEGLADRIKAYEKLPGRFVQSLEESSFDTWIKLYKPDADSANRTISYYLKGDLIGTCLDLEIRHRTEGQASLDDVVRRLYDRYAVRSIGFPESVYQETVEEVAGSSFEDFFAKYMRGTAVVPFETFLAYAGLELKRTYKNPDQEETEENESNPDEKTSSPPLPWLGVDVSLKDSRYLTVGTSYTTGPAARLLNPGDILIALNGFHVANPDDLQKRLWLDHQPGETVEVAYLRRGHLESISLILGEAPYNETKIVTRNEAAAEEKALFEGWLKAPYQEPKAKP